MAEKHIFIFDFWFSEQGERHELPIEGYDQDIHLDAIYHELNYRDLESRFGVHDWSTSEQDDGTIEDIGFTTYEVDKKEVAELLEIWKEILTNVGIKIVGPWNITKYKED
jgi:hypothetical protein